MLPEGLTSQGPRGKSRAPERRRRHHLAVLPLCLRPLLLPPAQWPSLLGQPPALWRGMALRARQQQSEAKWRSCQLPWFAQRRFSKHSSKAPGLRKSASNLTPHPPTLSAKGGQSPPQGSAKCSARSLQHVRFHSSQGFVVDLIGSRAIQCHRSCLGGRLAPDSTRVDILEMHGAQADPTDNLSAGLEACLRQQREPMHQRRMAGPCDRR